MQATYDERPNVPEPKAATTAAPWLFERREAVVLDAKLGSTTACQTTAASDYTPDD